MLKRIWILHKDSHYGVKKYNSEKLAEAFIRRGIKASTINLAHPNAAHIITGLPTPDLCCSFNTIIPADLAKIYASIPKIPYLGCITDVVYPILNTIKATCTYTASVDRQDCMLLKNNKVNNVFFWGHAVEKELSLKNRKDRELEVIFIGSCYEFEQVREFWLATYNLEIIKIIENAIEMILYDPNILTSWQAFEKALKESKKVDLDEMTKLKIFRLIDVYASGYDRFCMLNAINHAHVHVYGEAGGKFKTDNKGWSYLLKHKKNITIHPPVHFSEVSDLLNKSKICLNSLVVRKDGSHERLLAAPACGCLVLTTENKWIKEYFGENEGYIFKKNWEDIDDTIQYYLTHEKERVERIEITKKKVFGDHTWDARVAQLVQTLSHF